MGTKHGTYAIKNETRLMNLERIANFHARGWTFKEISEYFGHVDAAQISQWIRCPEYAQILTRIKVGVIGELDALLQDQEMQHTYRKKILVPAALGTLGEIIQDKKFKADLRLKAAIEILDRDGQYAKVSRMGLATDEQGGIGGDDSAFADAFIATLKSTSTAAK